METTLQIFIISSYVTIAHILKREINELSQNFTKLDIKHQITPKCRLELIGKIYTVRL